MLKAKNHFESVRRIRLLYSQDEDFRAIWDDYRLVGRAMRHYKVAGEANRNREYKILRGELVEEVKSYLKNSHRITGEP